MTTTVDAVPQTKLEAVADNVLLRLATRVAVPLMALVVPFILSQMWGMVIEMNTKLEESHEWQVRAQFILDDFKDNREIARGESADLSKRVRNLEEDMRTVLRLLNERPATPDDPLPRP